MLSKTIANDIYLRIKFIKNSLAKLYVNFAKLCGIASHKLRRVTQRMRRVTQRTFLQAFFSLLFINGFAQNLSHSIHYEQSEYYRQFGDKPAAFYDSLDGLVNKGFEAMRSDCQLQRTVFGFHPYWAGSDYLNYRWDLISDFCYFAYEVNTSNGEPESYHAWLTDPSIDSAQAHGVKVHLCATIFSGHTTFFTNPASRQTLITNLISLVQQRNADGINMDIEALPGSLGDSVTSFMRDLSVQLKAVLPQAKVSIDLPAVNWGDAFDIPGLDPYVDLFFIMGYDYYWNSSPQAGPVAPLYSLAPSNDYSLARTISYYKSAGMDLDKFVLGIPYYGRQWRTESGSIPSPILANGSALTYSLIRNNSATYNPDVYQWEQNSQSSCYIFFQNNNWYQCFIGLDRDLRKRYDQVNYHKLAGIGIWALGYDDGYNELWQAISDKFTDCYIPLTYDTLFDSGGPAWNYYAFEDYYLTIDQGFNDVRYLSFSDFNIEQGYDSLWLFAGPDTTFSFLGGYTGQAIPGTFTSDNGAFTLRFRSDGLQNASGWRAVFHDGSLGYNNDWQGENSSLSIFPNPANDYINVSCTQPSVKFNLCIYDSYGRLFYSRDLANDPADRNLVRIDVSGYSNGLYFVRITDSEFRIKVLKFMKAGSD
jgi:spore germination protein YaaH